MNGTLCAYAYGDMDGIKKLNVIIILGNFLQLFLFWLENMSGYHFNRSK